jgi:hypothetical protein
MLVPTSTSSSTLARSEYFVEREIILDSPGEFRGWFVVELEKERCGRRRYCWRVGSAFTPMLPRPQECFYARRCNVKRAVMIL